MSADLKKLLNRGGLIVVIAGVVAITIGGGDASSALETAGQVGAIVGSLLILVREIFN